MCTRPLRPHEAAGQRHIVVRPSTCSPDHGSDLRKRVHGVSVVRAESAEIRRLRPRLTIVAGACQRFPTDTLRVAAHLARDERWTYTRHPRVAAHFVAE